MKKFFPSCFCASLYTIALGAFLSCSSQPANSIAPSVEVPLESGVSELLATHRKKVISTPSYVIEFIIPEEREEPVRASETISFNLAENTQPLQLDFKEETKKIHQIRVNNKEIPIDHREEHILIAPEFLKEGNNTIDINFEAGNLSLNRNNDFLYTLLVPDRARTLFPVFDQPNLKATFTLSLQLPKKWQAIANGPVQDSVLRENSKTYQFATSDTISTYLFSFAAGDFRHLSRELKGTRMHFFHRETDEEKINLSLDPIFRHHADALAFMESYTDIPYPFQKFDFIAIPDFQYGGMEHVGAIDYKAASLFLDEGATKDQEINRSNLIAHETAHMWFGDLVTMEWFSDVWMKEVFANFMADKITQVSLEDTNYDLKFLIDHFPAAYSVDRTAGANPIRQPLANLQNAGSLYGTIIYHKAPVVMRQLEGIMGEQAFQQGLQQYLKKYAHQNASWPQLIEILDGLSERDLQAWNQVWVNEPGRPVFEWDLETENGKIKAFTLSQQAEDGSGRIWPQIFEVALVYPDHIKKLPVNMDRAELMLQAATGEEVPDYVLFNSSGLGYGVFPVEEQMAEHLFSLSNPVARASGYINLYENMLLGREVEPEMLLNLYMQGLKKEEEELNIKLLTTQLNRIFWQLLSPEKRAILAPALEEELWQAMQQKETANQKKLLFKTFQHMALSAEARETLFDIWKEQSAPEGIKLTEDDYTTLSLELAVRDYPMESSVLETQLQRIENPDRKKRLSFMIPALSSSEEERDNFFATLKDPKNREKEAWVTAALHYLHHPLRTDSSVKYLEESLQLLEEIQKTGDIFFPHAWLQASFGYYQSPRAAEIVRSFLQKYPDYSPPLKAKILQATDNLLRAEKLRNSSF